MENSLARDKKMLAWILKGPGQALSLEEVAPLVPGPGEVVIDLRAAALNHRDVWLQQGNYFMSKFPVVLGADGSGVVRAIGAGVNQVWQNAEVIVNPGLNWGNREDFARDDFRTLGTPDNGTFASQLLIPAEQLSRKPEHLDFIHAAALPLSGLTGFRALFSRGQLKAGESVLITGAGGGVAQFMMLFAKAAGARVYVTSGSEEKLARTHALGALGGANYSDAGWPEVLRAQEPSGFDLIVDSACGPDFGKLLSLARPGGRVVYFGLTAGPAPAFDMRAFYRNQLSLIGTKMGSLADFAAMVRFVETHGIVPHVENVVPFAAINDAFERLHKGQHFGKIVFNIS